MSGFNRLEGHGRHLQAAGAQFMDGRDARAGSLQAADGRPRRFDQRSAGLGEHDAPPDPVEHLGS
ncbi:hypothetical protein AB0D65_21985 [Streptomyces griseoloalbus]|uniref:Uncharacterized protein n=1 Tax=Streptomyces griseoloalbus TaxID=67303 RepID=A0ABV3E8W5_9ACTN